MKGIWWIALAFTNSILILGSIIGKGFTEQGIQAILQGYFVLSTAILVIAFAVIPIQREMFLILHKKFEEVRVKNEGSVEAVFNQHDLTMATYHTIDRVLFFSILTLFLSIYALWFSNLNSDFMGNSVIVLIYITTIWITISIAELADLALKIFIPKI